MGGKGEDPSQREVAVDQTVMFAMLAHAHLESDHRKAAKALNELEQLGVEISFKSPPRRSESSQP